MKHRKETGVFRSHGAQLSFSALLLFGLAAACGPQPTPRERDRAQQLEDAARRTQELSEVEGRFLGYLEFPQSSHIRRQVLDLEIAVVNEYKQGNNQADPVPLPTLSGKFDLVFGSRLDDRIIRFPVSTADYTPDTREMVLISADRRVKLTGKIQGGSYRGRWISDDTGEVGSFEVSTGMSSSLRSASHLGEYATLRSLDGTYRGVLNTGSRELPSTLRIQTVRKLENAISTEISGFNFSIVGNVTLTVGNDASADYTYYELSDVNYDYTTGKLALRSKDRQVILDGFLTETGFSFIWFSNGRGERWPVEYTLTRADDGSNLRIDPEPRYSSLPQLSGSYYGYLEDARSRVNWDLQLTFARENQESDVISAGNGALKLTAGVLIRKGWLEQRFYFPHVNYDYFTGKVFLRGNDGSAISGTLGSSGIEALWTLPTGENYGDVRATIERGALSPRIPDAWILTRSDRYSANKIFRVHPDSSYGVMFDTFDSIGSSTDEKIVDIVPALAGAAIFHVRREARGRRGSLDRLVLSSVFDDTATLQLTETADAIENVHYDSARRIAYWSTKSSVTPAEKSKLYRYQNGNATVLVEAERDLNLLGVFQGGDLLYSISGGEGQGLKTFRYRPGADGTAGSSEELPLRLRELPHSLRIAGETAIVWVDRSHTLFEATLQDEGPAEIRRVAPSGKTVLELGPPDSSGRIPLISRSSHGTWLEIYSYSDSGGELNAVTAMSNSGPPKRSSAERFYCPSFGPGSGSIYFADVHPDSYPRTGVFRFELNERTKTSMTSKIAFERFTCPATVSR